MFNIFNKKKQEDIITSAEPTKNNYVQGELINSSKTSRIGLFFVIIMVITGVWQGNNLFDSIKKVIELPAPLSADYVNFKNQYTNNNYENNYYGDHIVEPKFSSESEIRVFKRLYSQDKSQLDLYYKNLKDLQYKIKSSDNLINKKREQISNIEKSRSLEQSKYDTALLQDIANKNSQTFNQKESLSLFSNYEQQLRKAQSELSEITLSRDKDQESFSALLLDKKEFWSNNLVQSEYESYYFYYVVKVFLLSLVLVLPIFILVYFRYKKSKDNNSEYSIIWAGLSVIFAIFLLQIVSFLVTNIIPNNIIKALIELFSFGFMYIVFSWASFIILPLIFGFLAYRLQKKYYRIEAVKMRAIKSGVCPQCDMKIMDGSNNCPVCGFSIKVKCNNCGNMKYNFGDYCDKCGFKN